MSTKEVIVLQQHFIVRAMETTLMYAVMRLKCIMTEDIYLHARLLGEFFLLMSIIENLQWNV
jgi:hypothetical protein